MEVVSAPAHGRLSAPLFELALYRLDIRTARWHCVNWHVRDCLMHQDHRKRVKGFEPSTFSLGSCGQRTETPESSAVSDGADAACTGACTESPERVTEAARSAVPADFSEALAMIARLPLSDAEKAEAVRRLLAGANG